MIDPKRIALPHSSTLRRPPRAMLGYASLDDTFFLTAEGTWYAVADWRSWRHNEQVQSFRHAGVEHSGLSEGDVIAFSTANGSLLGHARVTAIRMTNAQSLTRQEIGALDYNDDEYQEFQNFENEAGWYVSLERADAG
ncbi:MAG: hypothetical protein ABI700_23580 [Chloroflexota bacterium]